MKVTATKTAQIASNGSSPASRSLSVGGVQLLRVEPALACAAEMRGRGTYSQEIGSVFHQLLARDNPGRLCLAGALDHGIEIFFWAKSVGPLSQRFAAQRRVTT